MNATTRSRGALGVLLFAMILGGCDFVSPTDTDPNAVPTATVNQLFTGIEVNTFFLAESQIARIAAIWTQQMAGTDRQFASLDAYLNSNEETADGEFSSVYTGGGLVDIKDAIAQAGEGGLRTYAGILEIHEAYMIGMAASIFGDIPYSEAATPGIDTPALDDQAAVYSAVQTLLDQAISDLSSGEGDGPGAIDMNFGGDALSWIAVAHTLKARFHLHWAEVNGASAYQAALAEAQQGIATPSGNWRTIHSGAATENNLWFQFMRDRSGYISAGDYLVPLMVARGDPRLSMYFSEDSDGGYAPRDSELSLTGYGAPDFDLPIVSCAENAYIRAEAASALGDDTAARAAAKDGLSCQEAVWGVDLSAMSAAVDALSGAALFDEIMTQKYTALFLNTEAFNDYKRTCRPMVTQRAGGMPGRLYYGQAERQSNPNIPEPAQQPARNDNDPDPCA
jgi:hypothetical protein